MSVFTKIVNPGTVEIGGRRREVFVKIEYREDGELSLTSVVGPWHSGNCAGSCGQIIDELKRIRPGYYHKGWTAVKVRGLRRIWRAWHLNHMFPGCEHQDKWDTDKTLLLPSGETKTAGWVTPDEHPEGILTKACPVCGYKYGSAWLKRPVPQETLDWLRELPDTKVKPAWV
jgi:hypothetical protein